ncbi:MAG: hypothetical protein LBH61_05655 [Dysgonamonadaceae bacterium]|jgi:hypothetical protein|nr:hypothetical protein [Dysgonamonadaceae bacterium]
MKKGKLHLLVIGIVLCVSLPGRASLSDTGNSRKFGNYKTSYENYSETKIWGQENSSEKSNQIASAPAFPPDPGMPAGEGVGIVSLLAMIYLLSKSIKEKRKTR